MTHEEAITLLHSLRTKYVCTPNHCGLIKNGEPCIERNCEGYHDALAMAIESLEKQMPKNPNKATDGSWGVQRIKSTT